VLANDTVSAAAGGFREDIEGKEAASREKALSEADLGRRAAAQSRCSEGARAEIKKWIESADLWGRIAAQERK